MKPFVPPRAEMSCNANERQNHLCNVDGMCALHNGFCVSYAIHKDRDILRCHFGISNGAADLRSQNATSRSDVEIEGGNLRSQIVISSSWGGLDSLEAKYDKQFKVVFDAIRELMTPPEKEKRRIGFRAEKGEKR